MATAKKHAQRSHKTYRSNEYVFGHFKPAVSHKQWLKANENRATFFEKISQLSLFNSLRKLGKKEK